MLRRLSDYFKQNVIAFLALFVALGGTGAYAANTIGSADIIDGSIKSVDVANQDLTGGDVKDGSLTTYDLADGAGVAGADIINNDITSADVKDGSLTSADIAPGTFVQGRGQLLSNRIVSTPPQVKTLLDIPGLGRLEADCAQGAAILDWINTTGGPVDLWTDYISPGRSYGTVAGAGGSYVVVRSARSSPDSMSSTLSLGQGDDPGPRKVTTIHVSAFQSANNAPCGFQAQGNLWTSP